MLINDHWRAALSGQSFSTGDAFTVVEERGRVLDRFQLMRQLARGLRVVHVGCVDHLVVIDEKMSKGQWMHGVIDEVADVCVGVDLNEEGIAALRQRGWSDVHFASVDRPDEFVSPDSKWDLLFLGEVLEHVDDPVAFLRSIVDAWQHRCDRVVISVPNAFSWSVLQGLPRSSEVINTDHRYWFTPFTIAKVAYRAGFKVESIRLCETYPFATSPSLLVRSKDRVLTGILRRVPLIRSCVFIELSMPVGP